MEKFSRPTIETRSDFYKPVEELRRKILDAIENKTEGINTERVERFFNSAGLSLTDYRLITRDQVPQVNDLMKDIYFEGEEKGYHITTLDIIFVLRNPTEEEINGPEYTEGILVHELAHGATEYAVRSDVMLEERIPIRFGSLTVPYFTKKHKELLRHNFRTGFAHQWTGSTYKGFFLEEGFAEMMRAQYMSQHMNSEVREKLARILEIPEEGVSTAFVGITIDEGGGNISIPAPLISFSTDGHPMIMESSLAASGLMTLCKKN